MTIGSFCGAILLDLKIDGTDFSTVDGEGIHNSKKAVRTGRRTIGGADFIEGTAGKSGADESADFDDTVEETAFYEYGVPEDLDPGDVSLSLSWISTDATITKRVSIQIDVASKGTTDNTLRDFTTSKSLENRNGASIFTVDEFPLTFAGIVPGESIGVKITRKIGDTIDDLTGDFQLYSLTLNYLRRG